MASGRSAGPGGGRRATGKRCPARPLPPAAPAPGRPSGPRTLPGPQGCAARPASPPVSGGRAVPPRTAAADAGPWRSSRFPRLSRPGCAGLAQRRPPRAATPRHRAPPATPDLRRLLQHAQDEVVVLGALVAGPDAPDGAHQRGAGDDEVRKVVHGEEEIGGPPGLEEGPGAAVAAVAQLVFVAVEEVGVRRLL